MTEPIRIIIEKSSGIKSFIDVLIAAAPTVIGLIIGAFLSPFIEWIKWKREKKQRDLNSEKDEIKDLARLFFKVIGIERELDDKMYNRVLYNNYDISTYKNDFKNRAEKIDEIRLIVTFSLSEYYNDFCNINKAVLAKDSTVISIATKDPQYKYSNDEIDKILGKLNIFEILDCYAPLQKKLEESEMSTPF
jgi:hypothetical protein